MIKAIGKFGNVEKKHYICSRNQNKENMKIKFEHITWKEYKKATKNPDPEIIAQCEAIKKIMDNRKK